MTTTTSTTASNWAAKIAAGEVDEFDMAALNSDSGLDDNGQIAIVWLRDGSTVVVWAGNDLDPDMNAVVEMAL